MSNGFISSGPPPMNHPHNTGQGHRRGQGRRRGRIDSARQSIGSTATNPYTMNQAFSNASNAQPMVSMMTATFNGITGEELPPPGEANTQMIPYQPARIDRHSQALTCKIKGYKEQEIEYKAIRKSVKPLAASLFIPGAGADLFPQDAYEWVDFKWSLFGGVALELDENAEKTRAMMEALLSIPKNKRQIKSMFAEDGKKFGDGLSPVLARGTVFSPEFVESGQAEEVGWPSQAELLECGDYRENKNVQTRCGRFLPPPRLIGRRGGSFLENQSVRSSAMDRAGPIFEYGPTPAELEEANEAMDNGSEFETQGRNLLGRGLSEVVGLPDWSIVLRSPPLSVEMAALVEETAELPTS